MRGVKQTRHGWGGRRGCVAATAALIATLTLLLPLAAHPCSPARAASPPPLPLSLVLYGARDLSPLTARFAAAYQARHPDLLLYVTASTLHPGFDNACGERDGATPVGKGAGVIGVSDVFIENDQLVLASCQDMINVPFAIGAVAAVYNLPGRYFARRAADGLTPLHPLRLSAPLIADIYAGRGGARRLSPHQLHPRREQRRSQRQLCAVSANRGRQGARLEHHRRGRFGHADTGAVQHAISNALQHASPERVSTRVVSDRPHNIVGRARVGRHRLS